MDFVYSIGFVLAIFVGIILGLLGSGGSILSVPILVYVMHVAPTLATAYSLFIVGITALIGGYQKAKQQLVDFNKVILFGIPTITAVFLTRRFIVPQIPEIIFSTAGFTLHKTVLTMLVFAVVMIFSSIRMLLPMKEVLVNKNTKINYLAIAIQGIFIGLIAGFVGAGGGFLLLPALLFLTKIPIKIAVGTSLFIVASQSLLGFLGDLQNNQIIDWQLIIVFTICASIGIFIGNFLSKKIDNKKLKISFGWFVLAMGIFIIVKELFLT